MTWSRLCARRRRVLICLKQEQRVSRPAVCARVVLAGDGNFAAWNLEVDAHGVLLALAPVAAAQLQHYAAAHNAVVIALELARLLPDGVVEGVRMSDAVKRDLERDLHQT